MNLAVTPVKFNSFSATQNCKNNNSQQNFEGLKVRLSQIDETSEILPTLRKRDYVIDRFMGKFEDLAKSLGINTDKLSENGFFVDFVPKFPHSSKMHAILKDGSQNIVQDKNLPVMFDLKRGNEFDQAECFVQQLGNLKLLG